MIWVSGTSYNHTGLDADTRYYYRVRADNSAADAIGIVLADDDANEGTATLTKDGQAALATAKTNSIAAPGAPHSLSAHAGIRSSAGDVDAQGVYLTWLTAESGGPALEYELVRMVQGEDDLELSIDATGATARTFYNDDDSQASLDNKERRYRVRASNDSGTSAWTEWVTYPLAEHTTHDAVSTELGTPSLPRPRVVTVGGIKTISILWDSGEGEERQIVQLLTEDRMFVDSQTVMPDVETYDFDNDGQGIAPGTYRVQIVALGMGTDFRNSGTVVVTVE